MFELHFLGKGHPEYKRLRAMFVSNWLHERPVGGVSVVAVIKIEVCVCVRYQARAGKAETWWALLSRCRSSKTFFFPLLNRGRCPLHADARENAEEARRLQEGGEERRQTVSRNLLLWWLLLPHGGNYWDHTFRFVVSILRRRGVGANQS